MREEERNITILVTYEDMVRRWPYINEESDPHQESNQPAPWSWTSQLPEMWEICVYCLSHQVYAISNSRLIYGENRKSLHMSRGSYRLINDLKTLEVYNSGWFSARRQPTTTIKWKQNTANLGNVEIFSSYYIFRFKNLSFWLKKVTSMWENRKLFPIKWKIK